MPEKKIELDGITQAIIVGWYSWACVLFLQQFEYNPQNYIAYRTYIRLINEKTKYVASAPKNKNSINNDCGVFCGDIEVILNEIKNGKYSWACALILRSLNMDPKLYISERTFSRISKENAQKIKKNS
jgi:hypothetical protein